MAFPEVIYDVKYHFRCKLTDILKNVLASSQVGELFRKSFSVSNLIYEAN